MNKKLTADETIALMIEEDIDPGYYNGPWHGPHPILGRSVQVFSEMTDYDEGTVTTLYVYQFENSEEPVGYYSITNSWNDYYDTVEQDGAKFFKVKKVMREAWEQDS